MSLLICSLCGKIYDSKSVPVRRKICRECLGRLDGMYSGIHEYIARHGEMKGINLQEIAEGCSLEAEDVKLLLDMGYFERDIQTYGKAESERQRLAEIFERELKNMQDRGRLSTYGGEIYRRKQDKEG